MFNTLKTFSYLQSVNYKRIRLNPYNHSWNVLKNWSSTKTPQKTEDRLKSILSQSFPEANSIDIIDVSGGCGAMFDIAIQAPQFKGLSIVKQHKLVTEALKEEIKDMHGLRIHTSV